MFWKTNLIYFVFIILFSSLILAPCPDEPGCSWDENNPFSFNYQYGDYTAITDWSRVDQNLVPLDRIAEILPNQVNYLQLSQERRWALTAEQIAPNLEKIDDLTRDVIGEEAIIALQRAYSVKIDSLGGGARVRNGQLQATTGVLDHVTLTNSYYQNGKLMVTLKGEIWFLLNSDVKVLKIQPNDVLTVKSYDYVKWGDQQVAGDLSFENGQLYFKVGNSIYLDGVLFWGRDEVQEKIQFYFDGLEHEGSYVSLNKEKGTIIVDPGQKLFVIFQSENTFVEQKEGSLLEFILNNGKLLFERREGDLIPKVTYQVSAKEKTIVKGDSGEESIRSDLIIINGEKRYDISNAGREFSSVSLDLTEKKPASSSESPGSAAFRLDILNSEGKNTQSWKEENDKIIFDNSNNVVFFPTELDPEVVESKKFALDLSKSRVTYSSLRGRILERASVDDLDTITDLTQLDNLLYSLRKVPDNVLEGVNGIKIVPRQEIWLYCYLSKPSGCAVPIINKVYLAEEALKLNDQVVLYHEAAHVHTFKIYEQEHEELEELRKEMHRLKKEISSSPSFIDLSPEKKQFRKLQEKAIKLGQNRFLNKWERASSGVGKETQIGLLSESFTWSDGGSGARYGFVRPYGRVNILEDISTFVEDLTVKDYKFYQDLIDAKSSFYQKLMDKPIAVDESEKKMTPQEAQKWARAYRAKLNLLHEYEFITDEDYREVVKP